MARIGIRELRQHASKHVAAAAAGEEIIVTDRGKPVARLVPLSPMERQIQYLVDRYGATPPSSPHGSWSDLPLAEGPSLSDEIISDREDREVFGL